MRLDVSIQRRVEDANRPFALDVTFASDARRIVLFGPSGAGKSLTLRAIAGLLRPGHGHVRVAGSAGRYRRRECEYETEEGGGAQPHASSFGTPSVTLSR